MSKQGEVIRLGQVSILPGNPGVLFSLSHNELTFPILLSAPSFEVNGRLRSAFVFSDWVVKNQLPNGGSSTILRYSCGDDPILHLEVEIRSFPSSSIIRFKYRLTADVPSLLTKSSGHDRISYFRIEHPGLETLALTEYQLSHFDPVQHSYMPNRVEYAPDEILTGMTLTGPVSLFHSEGRTILCAYEHGADHPLTFLKYAVESSGNHRSVVLLAEKGNYYAGQSLGPDDPWESIWFELGLFPDSLAAFLPEYRRFFLDEVCENRESRRPNIYYNTWNYQERQKYFHNRPYLESMNAERILAEIDVAGRLGVDVFVIDTGWFQKTGDWLPNTSRFPENLFEVKQKLDQYGMQLGLWFNPTVAALTSRVFQNHPEWEMEWDGKPRWRGMVWETEESTGMCLASDYVDDYIDVMVRLNRDLGVTYFKWDGVSQYGCDSSHHNHGSEVNSVQERRDCYAFEMGRSMVRIVDEVTRRCPGVIVDFDITEDGRFVGLGFLSVGKFFLVNNGPYFKEFDIPGSVKIEPDTINVFFYPGPARPRICRQGIKYDEIIPSILFLTHYLPDPPLLSQKNSMASIVLGGNGIWGDLLALSEEDIRYLSEQVSLYKQVAEAVTRSFPRMHGFAGSSPEIYEKIDPDSCSGMVVFFTVTPGTFTYYTRLVNLDQLRDVTGADEWSSVEGGRLKITVSLERDDARIVFILAKGNGTDNDNHPQE
jgi:alpha-galactosidase